ncbi:MBL fold metallo-hydrolase [Xylanibacillus composti]|uniref:MBL fold metallo-hydrolase n=1 Tax=Xylanibacillus composti TaxID=1572762 RepID=UPI001BCD2C67|nr:MBL fold metallo-hydrolase [Xylanibacillus composti]MDT9726239.1 MBL fold metallo-hydrolase [Xylanibacillus composti]
MRVASIHSLYQISFMPRLLPVNCYLVEEEDGLTLIDAALPYSASGILQAARQVGKPIRRIVLTHAHADHVGALDALKRRLPEASVAISERDARLLAGDLSLDPDEAPLPIRGGIPKKITTVPDHLLKEGDRIGSLTAISVPGHTPGSMAFLDERTGAVVAGDALQTRGGIAVAGLLKPSFPFPAMATWNKQAAIRSAAKLLALSPALLAVGHGPMLEQPERAMEQAIDEAKRAIGGR